MYNLLFSLDFGGCRDPADDPCGGKSLGSLCPYVRGGPSPPRGILDCDDVLDPDL